MIQRIQTLYLLVVVGLMSVTLFAPLAWFAGDDAAQWSLRACGVYDGEGAMMMPMYYIVAALVLAGLLPLVTIFLYNRRPLQIRLCSIEIVLLLLAVAAEVAGYALGWIFVSGQPFPVMSFLPAAALPLASILFAYLAAKAVMRDEMLVRAADRIR